MSMRYIAPTIPKPGFMKRLAGRFFKSLLDYDHTSWGTSYIFSTGGAIDYRERAGRLDHSTIIMACINWACKNFPEAPHRVMKRDADGKAKEQFNHKLTQLINNPNLYYPGMVLWGSTLSSLNLCGNGYWLIFKNEMGRPVQLWWEPHHTIRPVLHKPGTLEIWQDPVSHYDVLRNGHWHRIEKDHVMHFKGIKLDQDNPVMGTNDLIAALREVYTDHEAADYTASLLHNMGIPGVVISPGEGEQIDDPEAVKQDFMKKFTGDKRGEPMVMGGATRIQMLSFSPTDLNLRELRRIPEERISGLIGVPAIVAGLGAGLDRSTFANMGEAREMAYENNIIPTQRLLAAQITSKLLPMMGSDPETEYLDFDLSQVRVLSEDENKKATRWAILFNANLVKRSEAKEDLGMSWDTTDEVYKNASAPALPGPLATDALPVSGGAN